MDCGQGKSNSNDNNDPATGQVSDEVGIDVASGQDGGQVSRASDGEEDATGNDSAKDVPIAIAPINKPVRLCKCESIPPPHGATPPSGSKDDRLGVGITTAT